MNPTRPAVCSIATRMRRLPVHHAAYVVLHVAVVAARVSSSDCSRERIAELDEALRSSTGQWQALPLRNLPDARVNGHYRAAYLFDSDVLPLQIFQTARDNGAMAALEEDRARPEYVR